MIKKMLLASCTLLLSFETSRSNVKKPEFVKINEIFKPCLVKTFRRKRLSRPIPYYHNSTPAQRIILSEDRT